MPSGGQAAKQTKEDTIKEKLHYMNNYPIDFTIKSEYYSTEKVSYVTHMLRVRYTMNLQSKRK